MKKILKYYYESIENIPILRYSRILIATIFILSLIAFFQLNNRDVFFYAVAVTFISFLSFIFSHLIKSQKKIIQIALYIIIYSIVITMTVCILGFASFVIFEKPNFYKRWFPDQAKLNTDSSVTSRNNKLNLLLEEKGKKSIRKEKIMAQNSKLNVVSIQLKEESLGYSKIFLDGKLITPLVESTRFNPRIEMPDNYEGNRRLIILTMRGDSCQLILPSKINYSTFRLVPHC